MQTETIQKQLFDRIAQQYALHYGDIWSQKYRWHFMNAPLLGDLDLADREILDGMCGNGETVAYLLHRKARVTGIDISSKSMHNFRRDWPQCHAICASMLHTGLKTGAYDCVVIVGGLHHVHPNVEDTIYEIHRILKPGGFFCFVEPHRGSLPDLIRRFWYRRDVLFEENEGAIDLERLRTVFDTEFDFIKEEYKGNIAYLCVQNSLILRIPFRLKQLYAPFLIGLESILQGVQGKRLSCFAVSQWRKKEAVPSPENGLSP